MKKTRDLLCPERRTFLKAGAGFMGASILGAMPFRAFAQASELAPADRCFVFVYFAGGWDQLLAFDPRDPDEFTADRITDTRILPGYSLITDATIPKRPIVPEKPGQPRSNIDFGPAVGSLANHYDLMTVVRGINMTTLGHEVGFRYFLTGKRPQGSAARGSSTATEIVGQMKPAVPIPSIACNIETYNDRYPGTANALRVSKAADLILTLSPSGQQLDSEIEKQLLDFRGQPISCEAAAYGTGGVSQTYETSREQMRTVLSKKLHEAFKFELKAPLYPEQEATRLFYKLPDRGPYDSPAGRAAMVATALKKGISQCVSINLTGGLDTHFGTQTVHAQRLRDGFEALSLLVDDLKRTPHKAGGSFMDRTTILVFSEFARTPLINSTGGRDHHISSSCMLMGAGLKHNRVFGRSGDIGMAPGLIDLKTGASDPNGENILPEHIIATVLASAQLDYSYMRVEPLRALLA
jgi:uncharacterized protein (DUF1501 family)